jgi:DICT domain-containing protein
LTAEAKQLAAKKLAADREADVKMEAFNRRLVDMIRQGKEALGTRVEVEQDGDVGMAVGETPGWVDDDSGIF